MSHCLDKCFNFCIAPDHNKKYRKNISKELNNTNRNEQKTNVLKNTGAGLMRTKP